jgi:hypothetical protein
LAVRLQLTVAKERSELQRRAKAIGATKSAVRGAKSSISIDWLHLKVLVRLSGFKSCKGFNARHIHREVAWLESAESSLRRLLPGIERVHVSGDFSSSKSELR